jgi:hypothetical protein
VVVLPPIFIVLRWDATSIHLKPMHIALRADNIMANTARVRNCGGLPATFAGSKTGQDDAPFVFIKVGDEERRMRWAEWDALPAWTGAKPARTAKT